jgi:hypothetical protein
MAQSKVHKKSDGGMKMILYPDDAKNFLKWGVVGFLGLGAYQLFMTLAKRNINPSVDFIDQVESMNCDPLIRDAMMSLQSYRQLNPWLFKSALQNIDQLLFLENALLNKQIKAVHNDKVASWSFFRMALSRLEQFQFLVRERLGNEHGLTVNIFARKIYAQLQKHILNVLHMCSEFKPEHLLARAPLEVERVLKNYEEGREPVDSYKKWDELRSRLDKKRSKHKHVESEDELLDPKHKSHHKRKPEQPEYESRKSRQSRSAPKPTNTNVHSKVDSGNLPPPQLSSTEKPTEEKTVA